MHRENVPIRVTGWRRRVMDGWPGEPRRGRAASSTERLSASRSNARSSGRRSRSPAPGSGRFSGGGRRLVVVSSSLVCAAVAGWLGWLQPVAARGRSGRRSPSAASPIATFRVGSRAVLSVFLPGVSIADLQRRDVPVSVTGWPGTHPGCRLVCWLVFLWGWASRSYNWEAGSFTSRPHALAATNLAAPGNSAAPG